MKNVSKKKYIKLPGDSHALTPYNDALILLKDMNYILDIYILSNCLNC